MRYETGRVWKRQCTEADAGVERQKSRGADPGMANTGGKRIF